MSKLDAEEKEILETFETGKLKKSKKELADDIEIRKNKFRTFNKLLIFGFCCWIAFELGIIFGFIDSYERDIVELVSIFFCNFSRVLYGTKVCKKWYQIKSCNTPGKCDIVKKTMLNGLMQSTNH